MIHPEFQDAITSGIATLSGLPHEQTEAALQVLSGAAKLAKSIYNPDGSVAPSAAAAANQRKYFGPQQEEQASWFPWAKNPMSWLTGKSSHGAGRGHGGSYGYDVHHGGNAGANIAKAAEGHAAGFSGHQIGAQTAGQAQHVGAAQVAHAQEGKGALAQEQHTAWAKKGGVDLGFDYGFHFDRKKQATAEHSHESAWNCSEQAASVIRKLYAFDVCGLFGSDKRGAIGSDHGFNAGFEHDADGSHHWQAEHGHGN